jgi:hypothetical protein
VAYRPAELAFVGLHELDRPSAGGVDLPQVGAACHVGGEQNLFAVWGPGSRADGTREIKVVNRSTALTLNEIPWFPNRLHLCRPQNVNTPVTTMMRPEVGDPNDP